MQTSVQEGGRVNEEQAEAMTVTKIKEREQEKQSKYQRVIHKWFVSNHILLF